MSTVLTDPARDVEAALARLTRLYPRLIDLSLDRIRVLLRRLGDPERALPPIVHVAGTNGKGSTLAILRAILEAAGLRVHVYTSPHLVRYNERIRLAGALIEDAHLLALLEEAERVNAGAPITFFEITTAAAFLAFARVPADVLLLETGLGGRSDATNVIERPAATAITRISFDHMQYLGDTLTAIAGEKAGILKPGAPVVVAPQAAPEVLDVFRRRAAALGVPLVAAGEAWRVRPTATGFRFAGARWDLDLPPPALVGAHQIENAGTALAVLEQMPALPVSESAIRTGLGRVEWPARLQRLTRGPLPGLLPPGWELWLDGAHNDSGAEVLAGELARWRAADGKPVDLVMAALTTKRPADILRPLVPQAEGVATVPVAAEHAAWTPEELAAQAEALGLPAIPAADVGAALRAILAARGPAPRRVVICGSLYLAGAVLAENG